MTFPVSERIRTGIVWQEGLVTSPTTGNNAFTLPLAYRGQYSVNFATAVSTAGTEGYGRLRIIGAVGGATDGVVGIVGPNAPSTWGSICASWACHDRSPGIYSCFPLQVNCNTTSISTVLVASVYDNTSSTHVPISLGTPDWTASKGGFTLNNLPGLLLGKKYTVTFLILGS